MTTNDARAVVADHVIGARAGWSSGWRPPRSGSPQADGDRVVVRTRDGRALPDRVIVEATDGSLTIRENDRPA